MNNELAHKSYWQQSWEQSSKLDVSYIANPFKKQFDRHIPSTQSEKFALEVGCVPGIYLGYLARDFGYTVEGIDYVEGARETTMQALSKFRITEAEIYEEDFLQWQAPKPYDLVCSFGFIEHFVDPSDIINKHVEVLAPGGTLLLEIPNFSGAQYFLHKYLDRTNLDRHNTDIMNLGFFRDIAAEHNLDIACLEYTGGMFDFWWENNSPHVIQKIVATLLRPLAYIGRKIPVCNRFFSPFIIMIATKQS